MYEISRYLPYFQKTRSVVAGPPTSTLQLCTPNPDRVLLMISISIGSQYWLSTVTPIDTLAADIAGTGPDVVLIDWRHQGPLVTEAFWGEIGGASGSVKFVVTEYVFKPPADDIL